MSSTTLSNTRAAWLPCHIMDRVLDLTLMENSGLTFTWPLFIHLTCIYQATMCMLFAMPWGYMMNRIYLLPWRMSESSVEKSSCQILTHCVKCDSTITWSSVGAQRKEWVIVWGSWMVKSFLPIKKSDEDPEGHLLLTWPDLDCHREPYSLSQTMAKKRQGSKISQLCFLLVQESSVFLKGEAWLGIFRKIT